MPPIIAPYNVSHAITSVGGVPGNWFRPDGVDELRRTIVYFHSGGYVGTSPWMSQHSPLRSPSDPLRRVRRRLPTRPRVSLSARC